MKSPKIHNLLLFTILIIFFLQLIGLGFLFFCPVKIASAQIKETLTGENVKFTPQVDIPGSSTFRRDNPITFNKYNRGLLLAQYIQAWYKFAVAGVGILAVVMIMAGGLIWLTAGGRANQISTAKDWIAGAIVGLILALMSYTLLDILNPDLVTFQSLNIPEIELVESGLCCFSNKGQASAAEAKDCTKLGGTICNVLQACRKGKDDSYACADTEEGASCSDEFGSAETCPEGWFCVNGGCWNGSATDPCDMEKTSCAAGFYCNKSVCYDGNKGDSCDSSKTNQCNQPMICDYIFLKSEAVCQYNRSTGNCIRCNQPCESNPDCCAECGDCEGVLEGGGWQATCVVPN